MSLTSNKESNILLNICAFISTYTYIDNITHCIHIFVFQHCNMFRTRFLLPFVKQQYKQTACLCSHEVTRSTAVNFEDEFIKNHIATSPFQRAMLAVGSSFVSLMDPRRGDMIACLGEVTGNIYVIIFKVIIENSIHTHIRRSSCMYLLVTDVCFYKQINKNYY